jgi:hypothetical protein
MTLHHHETTTSPPANKRYTRRDLIYYFGMRAILITMVLALMLFMLFRPTSMLGLYMLVCQIVMIYTLVLISKPPTLELIFLNDVLEYTIGDLR